jgi:LEA14-like dessication related protein
MPKPLIRRRIIVLGPALVLAACANLPGRDPPSVTVAGIEPLQGEGLELRFLVKLRILNPNDGVIEFQGAFVELDLLGQSFASGVSDAAGTVPAFGETVLAVPVTVSAWNAARQALSLAGGDKRKLAYQLRGKLGGSMFGSVRFESKGELDLANLAGPARR